MAERYIWWRTSVVPPVVLHATKVVDKRHQQHSTPYERLVGRVLPSATQRLPERWLLRCFRPVLSNRVLKKPQSEGLSRQTLPKKRAGLEFQEKLMPSERIFQHPAQSDTFSNALWLQKIATQSRQCIPATDVVASRFLSSLDKFNR